MKGLFEFFLQKNGESYKILSSMAGMIETSAANHMIFRFLLNGIFPMVFLTEFKTGYLKS
jgi:hypothetical protein